MKIEQEGDLLKIGGVAWPVIMASNAFFNASGKAVVCPIVKDARSLAAFGAEPVNGTLLLGLPPGLR